MKTKCPFCEQNYDVDNSFEGQEVACTQCNKSFLITNDDDLAQYNTRPKYKRCRACCEEVLVDAKKCRYCGEILDIKELTYLQNREKNKISKFSYFLRWWFFGMFGWHNLYAREYKKRDQKLRLHIFALISFVIGCLLFPEEGNITHALRVTLFICALISEFIVSILAFVDIFNIPEYKLDEK